MNPLRRFIQFNQRLSARFEHTVLAHHCTDGMTHFSEDFLPGFLRPGMLVYDVGGGRTPVLSLAHKRQLDLTYIGLDVSQQALAAAPAGLYDATVCSDIAHYQGHGEADLCICRALLEHVADVDRAFDALASLLKPGGLLVLFVPCRNALYARLALLIGEDLKKRLLFFILPQTRAQQGFPSYYARCTPSGFVSLANPRGLTREAQKEYLYSFYTAFLFPLHVCYRLTTLLLYRLLGSDFCEGFSMALRKAP